MVNSRKNGKFTCLDCKKTLTQFCKQCKNWELFELDQDVIKLSYEEKLDRNDKLKNSLK